VHCRQCGSDLDRPGDYCLVCHTENTECVVVEFEHDRATMTMLRDGETVGETTITTVPTEGAEEMVVERRNFAGRIADEIRRKRPTAVYAAGDRDVIRETRAQLRYEFYRVDGDDPVETVLARGNDPGPAVVETAPAEKIGGAHSTLIAGRDGRSAVGTVAEHPHVKKIVPGPIDAGGSGSRSGVTAKATRADENGNVRLLLRDGSSVQENRIVTTANDRDTGERVRADLNEALADAGLR
jgi:hypothetical protein